MSKFSRIYDFRMAENGVSTLDVEGSYVRIMSSTGAVELVTDSYRLGPIRAGQGQQDAPYRRLTIVDKSGRANAGTILVASSGFIDQRMSGEISIVNSVNENNKTVKNCYSGNSFSAAEVSEYPYAQLFNPVGSGVLLNVSKILMSWTGAIDKSLNLYFDTAPISALSSYEGANTNSMGDLGEAELRAEASASLPAYPKGILFSVYQDGMQPYYIPQAGLIINPGHGLNVFGDGNNVKLLANFEWTEEPV